MDSCQQKTVLMRVLFSDRSLASHALENWGRDRRVAVCLRRGRCTSEDALLELEITGVAQRIARFMAQISARGASVGTIVGGAV